MRRRHSKGQEAVYNAMGGVLASVEDPSKFVSFASKSSRVGGLFGVLSHEYEWSNGKLSIMDRQRVSRVSFGKK